MRLFLFIAGFIVLLWGFYNGSGKEKRRVVYVTIEQTEKAINIYHKGRLAAEYFLPNDSCEVATLSDIIDFALEIE
jgi:hypothetical protein